MFDSGYLARGLALIASLRRVGADDGVVLLALDDACAVYLRELEVAGVSVMTVDELVGQEPALARARTSRNPVEFIFTCTASLVNAVLRGAGDDEWVVYLDSDMSFFRSPSSIFADAAHSSVGIIPHRYPRKLRRLRKYGTYNVGWVMFRNDAAGRHCCTWWRDATIAWCHDYPEDGKYADQGYLDRFSEVCDRVVVLDDPGLNVAPWNLAGHTLTVEAGSVLVDGAAPLIFYHYQGLRRDGATWYPNLRPYRARLSRVVREAIYEPYIREIQAIEVGVHSINNGCPLALRSTRPGARDDYGWRARARRARRVTVNALDRATGQVIGSAAVISDGVGDREAASSQPDSDERSQARARGRWSGRGGRRRPFDGERLVYSGRGA